MSRRREGLEQINNEHMVLLLYSGMIHTSTSRHVTQSCSFPEVPDLTNNFAQEKHLGGLAVYSSTVTATAPLLFVVFVSYEIFLSCLIPACGNCVFTCGAGATNSLCVCLFLPHLFWTPVTSLNAFYIAFDCCYALCSLLIRSNRGKESKQQVMLKKSRYTARRREATSKVFYMTKPDLAAAAHLVETSSPKQAPRSQTTLRLSGRW